MSLYTATWFQVTAPVLQASFTVYLFQSNICLSLHDVMFRHINYRLLFLSSLADSTTKSCCCESYEIEYNNSHHCHDNKRSSRAKVATRFCTCLNFPNHEKTNFVFSHSVLTSDRTGPQVTWLRRHEQHKSRLTSSNKSPHEFF